MILKLIATLGFLYILLCSILFLLQKKFIFYPTQLPDDYPFKEFEHAEEQRFESTTGNQLHALWFAAPQPKAIVLYFHGNAGGLEKWGYAAADFTRRGYAVLIPDYPTYGKSKGILSEANLHEDAIYLYDHLQKQYPSLPIIVYGRSLGTGIASTLASKRNPKLLILETPYFNLLEMAKLQLNFLPLQSLMLFHLRSDLNLPKVKCPIHIFHGTKDELIPYTQAVQLAQLAAQDDILTTIENGGHNNLGSFAEFQRQLDVLLP